MRSIELIAGELKVLHVVHVMACDGAEVPCATWRTEGFAALGHPELTLTLRRAPEEGEEVLSLDAVRFFLGMFARAQGGATLRAGMTGEFPSGLFEAPEAHGSAFVRSRPLGCATLPPRGITVVVLHRAELRLAHAFGLRRVLARIARQTRCVPSPPWWDPARAPVTHPDDDTSELAPIARINLAGSVAALRGETVVMTLLPEHAPGLAAMLAARAEAPFALYTDAPADADAFFVWSPGQRGPSAATIAGATGDCVAGNFVAFRPGAPADRVAIMEDGFALDLTPERWAELRAAIAEAAPFEVPAARGARGFSLAWQESSPDQEPAHFERAEVMTGLAPPRPGIEAPALTTYARSLRDVIERHFTHTWTDVGQDLLVHIEMHPGRRPGADLALRPGPPSGALNGLLAAMREVEAPRVTAPVVFRVYYSLWGGARAPSPDG